MTQRSTPAFDPHKFEYLHQVGGIQTGTLDYPQPAGGQHCRVAFVNTGGGLRFTVAIDRGGDIVEAAYREHSLAYLTPNGYAPPDPARNRDTAWLRGWPGGLLTTCGPEHIGAPAPDPGSEPGSEPADSADNLHGRFSNTPAALLAVRQPDPRRGQYEMSIELLVRVTRMFGPVYEIHRTLSATLGQPEIRLRDRVTNLGNQRVPHHLLYHCNFGYPLLDAGAQIVMAGKLNTSWGDLPHATKGSGELDLAAFKQVPGPLAEHAGAGEGGVILDPTPDRQGVCRVGLINRQLQLGVELSYPLRQLPRLANWQHFGPNGSYVCGIEPFNGGLMSAAEDKHPKARPTLRPGQTKTYELTIRVLRTPSELDALAKRDRAITG